MTQFVDESSIDLDADEYTDTDFAGIKYEAAEDKDQGLDDEPMQKTAEDEAPDEPDEEPGITA